MPQQLGAPGVYIEEIPSGRRVIRSVSTSIAAFVDFFREGPMNEPVRIFGTGDFERVFGGYDTRSESSFQIPQFFLNGGTEAWVVRVAAGTPLASAVTITDATDANCLTVTAASPGVWGDTVRVEIDYNGTAADRFNMRVIRFVSTDGNSQGLSSETFLNLSTAPTDARFIETIVNDESQMVTVDALTTGLPVPNGITGGVLDPAGFDFDALGGSTVLDVTDGTDTSNATLTWPNGEVASFTQVRGRLEAAIQADEPGLPLFSGARVLVEGNRFRILAGRRGAAYDPTDVISASGAAATALDLIGANATERPQQFELTGGADGTPPGAAEMIGTNAIEPPTGMFSLDNVDLFNIMCLPRAVELGATDRDAIYSNAISYCEDRRAMLVLDIPNGTTTLDDMTDLLAEYEAAGYRSENASLYYSRPLIPDPTDDFRLRAIGASGTIAGLYARTDTARGVWKAPAGIEATLEGVSRMEAQINDGQNGVLNPLGVNALRTFPIYGTICWGSRTMVGADALASEWAYVPVRRLALMLEESLFRGTQWVVFEPNDEPTWANIRLNVGAFMNGLFQQGAFQGAAPRDAYYVKCDAETTTQNDIDLGIVNIEVGFAPLKPAEFVVIRFRQIVNQSEV